MSNKPTPDSIEVSRSALGAAAAYIVLIAALGAVLMLMTGMPSQSSVRASLSATPSITPTIAPTSDAFGFAGYRPFASPDGVIRLEFPDTWKYIPDERGQKVYTFSADNDLTSGVAVQIQFGLRTDLTRDLKNVTDTSTAQDILTQAFAQSGQTAESIQAVKVGALTGAKAYQPNAPDTSNQPTSQSLETWLLMVDETHIALVRAISPNEQWTKAAPIVQHMMDTLQIDAAKAFATAAPSQPTSGTPEVATAAPTASK